MEFEGSSDTTGKAVIENGTPTEDEHNICDDVLDSDAKYHEEKMDISEEMDISEKMDTSEKIDNPENIDIPLKKDIPEKMDTSIQEAERQTFAVEKDVIKEGDNTTTTSSETDPNHENTEQSKLSASVAEQSAVYMTIKPDPHPEPMDSKEDEKPGEPLKNQQKDTTEENTGENLPSVENQRDVSIVESTVKDATEEHAVLQQEILDIEIKKKALDEVINEQSSSDNQSTKGLESEETKDTEFSMETSQDTKDSKEGEKLPEEPSKDQQENADVANLSLGENLRVESMEESTVEGNFTDKSSLPQQEISNIEIKKEALEEVINEQSSSECQPAKGLESVESKSNESNVETSQDIKEFKGDEKLTTETSKTQQENTDGENSSGGNQRVISTEESNVKLNVTDKHAVPQQKSIKKEINIKKEVLDVAYDEQERSVTQSTKGLKSVETKGVESNVENSENTKANTIIKEEQHTDIEKTSHRGSIISNIVSRLATVGPKSQTLKAQEENTGKSVEERASSSILGRHVKGDQEREHIRKSPGSARKLPVLAPLQKIEEVIVINDDSTAASTQQDHQSRICSNCCQAIAEPFVGKWTTMTVSGQLKQFCSVSCMNISPTQLTLCSYCKKDLTKDKVGAPSGPKDKFLEFCSHECVLSYEERKKAGNYCYCAVCSSLVNIKYKYSLKMKGNLFRLCSPKCQKAFMKINHVQPVKVCSECKNKFTQEGISKEVNGVKQLFCSTHCQTQNNSVPNNYTNCLICKKISSSKQLTEVEGPDGEKFLVCIGLCVTRLMHRLKTRDISLLPKESNVGTNKNSQSFVTRTPGSTVPSSIPAPAVAKDSQQQVANTQLGKSSTYATNSVNCNHCNVYQAPLYHLTMSDSTVRNFCSYPCVIGFQSQFNMPPVTLPQEELKLQCESCLKGFTGKPVTLSWKNEVHFFCSENCSATYKKTHCVIILCDNCIEERIHHTTIYFSGKERNFCSEGCQMLYKQSFTQKLGLRWCICSYCSQIGPTVIEKKSEGLSIKFCSKKCREDYDKWQKQLVKCEGCKQQGRLLTETFMWRGEVKKVCNQLCLLLFYTQQDIPNMLTETQQNLQNGKQTTKVAPSIPVISNVVSLASEQNSGIKKKPVEMVTKQTQITTTPIQPKPVPIPSLPPPKQVRNKMTLCKPIQQTKSTYCKPLTITKETNTEGDWRPKLVVVPIPVPIYVPVPMQMYTSPVPHPLGIPTPVPIPMFLPVTTDNADKLIETIKDIKNRTPSDPLEAELLAMADAIAGNDVKTDVTPIDDPASPLIDTTEMYTDDIGLLTEEEAVPTCEEPVTDEATIHQLEQDILALSNAMTGDTIPEKSEKTSEGVVSRLTRSGRQPTKAEVKQPSPTKKRKRAGQRSSTRNKRTKVDSESEEENEVEENEKVVDKQAVEERHYTIGIGAYKLWVATKNAELKQKSQQGGKAFSFKVDILANTSDELSYTLCHFVKEARQPNGDEYPPPLLFYILLTIQHHLFNSGHPDNIFTDLIFSRFMQYLMEKIKLWQPEFKPGSPVVINSNITEELMWECKQLGAHSPYVLLNTLVYFNTKFFLLKTVQDHKDLLFGMMFKDWKKSGLKNKIVCLRYFPTRLRKKLEATTCKIQKRDLLEKNYLEQTENLDNPLQCPVKLYEFYLSKCPESVKGKQNSLYLIPERMCIPDSPVWYSSCVAEDALLEKMLAKTLMVKDIHEYWAEKGNKADDDEDGDDDYVPEDDDS
ncbi:zinc finger MYM-type protein 2-like isoform X2 [Anneissia japonica]|uniref:zinc finger MYM-type protein 2-like isoform X2 n=1 Tax=Anneissia japonica TaxID=1529436 RepID=UPI00142594A3|nr:zinc finger MYM-type protein 2-like isoform X2 [Anneissia japonica]